MRLFFNHLGVRLGKANLSQIMLETRLVGVADEDIGDFHTRETLSFLCLELRDSRVLRLSRRPLTGYAESKGERTKKRVQRIRRPRLDKKLFTSRLIRS